MKARMGAMSLYYEVTPASGHCAAWSIAAQTRVIGMIYILVDGYMLSFLLNYSSFGPGVCVWSESEADVIDVDFLLWKNLASQPKH